MRRRVARSGRQRGSARPLELDSAAPLIDPRLVAEVDDDTVAAHSLSEGRSVANPFRPTADIVALLEARAATLSGRQGQPSSGWRTTGLRAAPASSSRRTGVV